MASRRVILPPDLIDDLGQHGERIDRLERRTTRAVAEADPPHVAFSYPGALVTGARSSPFMHPTGGRLIRARCTLGQAGITATSLGFYRNGTLLVPVQTSGGTFDGDAAVDPGTFYNLAGVAQLPEDQRLGVVYFVGVRFAPEVDELEVRVTVAGTGAERLTVRTDWAA